METYCKILAILSSFILNGLGIDCQVEGQILRFLVDETVYGVKIINECSGISSMESLLVTCIIYSLYELKYFIPNVIIILIAIPMAFLFNLIRILLIGVTIQINYDLAMGLFHDLVGIFIYLFELFLIINIHGFLVDKMRYKQENQKENKNE